MPVTATETCESCAYFKAKSYSLVGQCTRFPPLENHADSFPVVKPASWCGEYRRNASTPFDLTPTVDLIGEEPSIPLLFDILFRRKRRYKAG